MTEIERAKKAAEISKKLESANGDVKTYKGYLDNDILHNRDTSLSARRLENAAKKAESLHKELDRLM